MVLVNKSLFMVAVRLITARTFNQNDVGELFFPKHFYRPQKEGPWAHWIALDVLGFGNVNKHLVDGEWITVDFCFFLSCQMAAIGHVDFA